MICVFTPYAVYSSDVSQFDASQTYQILGALFGFFLLSSLGLIYLTSFLYKTRLLKFVAYIFSLILLIGFIYTFILTGDYGSMDHFVLQNPTFLNPEFRAQKNIQALCAFIASIAIVVLCFKYLKRIWQILFFTLIIVSVWNLTQISKDKKEYEAPKTIQQGDLEPYEKELFSYSKTHKNIVVFVLDMFSGSHIGALLEQFPELEKSLDGFTLFNNSTSTTNSTIHSIATLIGGEYYSVYNMNARKDNLASSVTQAFGSIGDTFVKNGYDVSYFMSEAPQTPKDIQAYNNNIFVTQNMGLYTDYYKRAHKIREQRDKAMASANKNARLFQLLSLGLFRFAPESYFRARIYKDGLWLLKDNSSQQADGSIYLDSSFYAFTHLHHATATKPTFKYLHSLISHMAYGLYYDNGKCSYFTKNTAWQGSYQGKEMDYVNEGFKPALFQHYDSEACALKYLGDFLAWLKDEGIYDNTQIFIVSDHGGFDSLGVPHSVTSKEARPDTLFLFKDFNARGALRLDSRLMINYDISSIFCENLPSGCPNVPKNILKHYPNHREIISTIPTSWELKKHNSNEWNLNYIYRVKGNIYDEKSWQDITKPYKDGTLKIDGKAH